MPAELRGFSRKKRQRSQGKCAAGPCLPPQALSTSSPLRQSYGGQAGQVHIQVKAFIFQVFFVEVLVLWEACNL